MYYIFFIQKTTFLIRYLVTTFCELNNGLKGRTICVTPNGYGHQEKAEDAQYPRNKPPQKRWEVSWEGTKSTGKIIREAPLQMETAVLWPNTKGHSKGKEAFQQMELKQLDIPNEKNINLNTDIKPFQNIASKWILDLNV